MLLLWTWLLCFQSTTEPDSNIRIDFTETVTLVNLPIQVRQDGKPYRKLEQEDLQVIENGVQIELERLQRVETPLTIHFLFDLSTSNEKHIFKAKKAVRDVCSRWRKGDRAKISYFSRNYQPLTDYTSERSELMDNLRLLTPVGTTALYEGLSGAIDQLAQESGPRVLVLFSDGHDFLSSITEAELMAKVKSYRIPILFVRFKLQGTEQPLLLKQRRFMELLVAESGGALVGDGDHYGRHLKAALKAYRTRYVASFLPPAPEDRDQWRSLVVRIPTCPGCQISYKRAYQISDIR